MRKLLIYLLLYRFILLANFTNNIYYNYNIKFQLNKFIKKYLKNRKLQNICVNKKVCIDNKNSTKRITDFKKTNNLPIKVIKKTPTKIFIKQNYSFLLIGFDSFIRKKAKISFSIYFKKSYTVFHKKLSFNINISFQNVIKNTTKKTIICTLDDYFKYQFLKYNCLFILNNNEKDKKIKRIQAIYDSFLFNNKSYEVILSPFINKKINNIQNGNKIIFKKFIKDGDYLYLLYNGSLIINRNNKIFYVLNLKLNFPNINNYNKTKENNIEGNYIFPFKNELNHFNETNIPCKIIYNKSNDTYNIKCDLNDYILTNINQAIGYGIDENIKNISVMLNVSEGLLNFKDNNILFYTINFTTNSYGLSAKYIAIIVVICVVILLIISLMILY